MTSSQALISCVIPRGLVLQPRTNYIPVPPLQHGQGCAGAHLMCSIHIKCCSFTSFPSLDGSQHFLAQQVHFSHPGQGWGGSGQPLAQELWL